MVIHGALRVVFQLGTAETDFGKQRALGALEKLALYEAFCGLKTCCDDAHVIPLGQKNSGVHNVKDERAWPAKWVNY